MCPDGKPDKCFDITYKDTNGKFIFEKVGWRSEGYTVQDALDLQSVCAKSAIPNCSEKRRPLLYPPA